MKTAMFWFLRTKRGDWVADIKVTRAARLPTLPHLTSNLTGTPISAMKLRENGTP